MAVKFRRIEESIPSVVQLQVRQDTRSRRFRLLPKVLLVLLVIATAYAAYSYYTSQFLVAPVLVEVNIFDVKSPATALIEWALPPEQTQIRQGEALFRLSLDKSQLAELDQRTEKAAIESAEAAAALKEVEESKRHLLGSLAAEEEDLRLKEKLATDGRSRAKIRLDKAREILRARAADLDNAKHLRRLDAVAASDYAASERLYAVAKADCDEAVVYLESADREMRAGRANVATFRQKREGALSEADAKIQAARERLRLAEHTERDLREERRLMQPVTVAAPMAGVILARYAIANQAVEKGDVLISVYDPASKSMGAFLSPRYSSWLRPGAAARVYPIGFDAPVEATVGAIGGRVIKLPDILRQPERRQDLYVVKAEIALPADVLAGLAPGHTGVARLRRDHPWRGWIP